MGRKLTPEQRAALDQVAKAAKRAIVARRKADQAQEAYVDALEASMRAEVPVADIADTLKVRRTGIYQTIKRRRKPAPTDGITNG